MNGWQSKEKAHLWNWQLTKAAERGTRRFEWKTFLRLLLLFFFSSYSQTTILKQRCVTLSRDATWRDARASIAKSHSSFLSRDESIEQSIPHHHHRRRRGGTQTDCKTFAKIFSRLGRQNKMCNASLTIVCFLLYFTFLLCFLPPKVVCKSDVTFRIIFSVSLRSGTERLFLLFFAVSDHASTDSRGAQTTWPDSVAHSFPCGTKEGVRILPPSFYRLCLNMRRVKTTYTHT